MEAEFWHDCWERGRIGFHQPDYNPRLIEFMPRLGLPTGAHVFVPLCGKSLDMLWLLGEGYAVTGIELNRIAVEDFFAENGLDCETREFDGGTAYRHGKLEILCADLFEAGLDLLPTVDAVYDRAALVALPTAMRRDYAGLMLGRIPLNTAILLLTLEYPQREREGPPFSVAPEEIESLYGLSCTIEPLSSEDCLEQHARWKEKGLTRLVEHVSARLCRLGSRFRGNDDGNESRAGLRNGALGLFNGPPPPHSPDRPRYTRRAARSSGSRGWGPIRA